MADDTGADRGGTIATARAHRRGAVSEFDLAHRAQRFWPAGAIHRPCLDIDGRNDAVAGRYVFSHRLDQIALAAAIPQMMMRIDDRARWIDDFFFPQCQPVFARIGIEATLRCGGITGGHGSSLPEWVPYLKYSVSTTGIARRRLGCHSALRPSCLKRTKHPRPAHV